jgi:CRP/FNR family transcriptional regulator, cyclic AMP receptor protein
MELIPLLKQVELFQGLTAAQLEKIVAIGTHRSIPEEAVIFQQGSAGDALYVIVNGQVEIRFDQPEGGSRAGLYMGAGQLVGEMALLDHGPRSATVAAVGGEAAFIRIGSADFMQLCQQDTAIGFTLMRNLAMDLSFKLRQRNYRPSSGD